MLYHLYANNINFLLNLFLSSEEVLFKKYSYIVLLQDALNKQTFGQFRSYAEQQCPGNPDQQALLIKQLQEQHYYQYMQRYYQYYFLLPVSGNEGNVVHLLFSHQGSTHSRVPVAFQEITKFLFKNWRGNI